MRKMFCFIRLVVLFSIVVFVVSCKQQVNDLASNVNVFIGTQDRGNLYPGATVPFGMVQLSPDNTEDGELAAGYQYNFNYIHGFSHTHISGLGIGDLTDCLIMPTTGKLHLNYSPQNISGEGYQSKITKTTEKGSPGYYAVHLDDYDIDVELTATERVGFHKYTFNQKGDANIMIDMSYLNAQPWPNLEIKSAFIKKIDNTTVVGGRLVNNWAPNRYVYFAAKFSEPFNSLGFAIGDSIQTNADSVVSKDVKAWANYTISEKKTILIKVAISSVSPEGALNNLNSELAGWDFEATHKKARQKWNAELNKFNADIPDSSKRILYYSSAYRTMLAPVLHADVDGKYRGSDGEVKQGKHTNYHVFGFWDTFRAEHPLLTIVQADRLPDIINSMLATAEEGGHLPLYHFGNGETNCMEGFHALPVIADAYCKGITGFDSEKALNAMIYDIHGNGSLGGEDSFKYAALNGFNRDNQIYSAKLFHKYGYVPGDMTIMAATKTLEYAQNSYCVGLMAKQMKKDTARYYLKAGEYYKNVFDPKIGFFRGKYANGNFRKNIPNPAKQQSGWDTTDENGDYVEGSAWQWLWFVPQDIHSLVQLLGGDEKFVAKLDTFFDPKNVGHITEENGGYIGQYAMGNEPGHHVAYLYNYAGQSWKTQKLVRDILSQTFKPTVDGLSGNDDCGEMSAWYVFGTLGLFPVNPSGGIYVFGSPAVKSAQILVGNNKTFEINVTNYAAENIYVKGIKLNGKSYDKTWISHADIMNGAKIEFEMDNVPNKQFGAATSSYPPNDAYN